MDTKNQAWLEKGLGKQLLLKMGWKEGEGLGAAGQGRKGNVQVRKVFEQRGLGFNSSNEGDAGVVKQIHGLNDVLASLQQEHSGAEVSTKAKRSKRSAETEEEEETSRKEKKKSKKRQAKVGEEENEEEKKEADTVEDEEERPKSRRRRTYRKFLDAKDVSLYSKQDLKAILGGVDV